MSVCVPLAYCDVFFCLLRSNVERTGANSSGGFKGTNFNGGVKGANFNGGVKGAKT